MRRLSYEFVKSKFEERGCELLSKEYVRSKDKLTFRCTCGEVSEISFDKFSRGQLCGKCSHERRARKSRHTIQYVHDFFESQGCTLLSKEYMNNKQKLNYICVCGNESEITFAKFQSGQRCQMCRNKKISKKLSGKNNHLYNHLKTDEERIRDRKYPEYYEWRRSVFERDNYTCQNCFEKGGTLNAHHIEAFSRAKELRTEVSNGVTLCKECHKEYHSEYYRNDANEESYLMFLRGEHNDPPPYID